MIPMEAVIHTSYFMQENNYIVDMCYNYNFVKINS